MNDQWPRYPLSGRLLKSIQSLFQRPEDGLKFLGLDQSVVPGSWVRKPEGALPYQDRVKRLKEALELRLDQMAAEHLEYVNEVETARLRGETVGILLTLHEIWLNFPEID